MGIQESVAKSMVAVSLLFTNLFVTPDRNGANHLAVNAPVALVNDGRLILFNESGLEAIKREWLDGTCPSLTKSTITTLLKSATNDLHAPLLSVTQKKRMPPGATTHDYVTLAKYYWPNPSHPSGPYVLKDGYTNPSGQSSDLYDEARKTQMVSTVSRLSLAYAVTGDERFARHATDMVRAWFITPSTRMNPSLNFSQGIPGKTAGSYGGIIDTVPFIQITDDIRMLESSQAWTNNDDKEMKQWFSSYLNWLLRSPFGKKESTAQNNQGTWYDAQVASYALFVGQNNVAKQTIEGAKHQRIDSQIQPNGIMPKEVSRTKSLDYSVYNLQALCTLARIGEKIHINLWSYASGDGRSIRGAINYLMSAATGRQEWGHPDISQTGFRGMTRYLGMANQEYRDQVYANTIASLTPAENAEEQIAATSFSIPGQ